MSEVTEFYLNEKPVMALVMIYNSEEETFCREISNDIDSTYAHTVKIIAKFKKMEVLTTQTHGRKKMISLTSKGKRQAKIFDNLLEELLDTRSTKKGNMEDKRVFK